MSVTSLCTCTRDGEGWTERRGCPVHDDTLARRQGETIYRMTVQIASMRHALTTVRAECDLPDHIAEFIGDVLAASNESDRESEKGEFHAEGLDERGIYGGRSYPAKERNDG